MEMKEKNCLFVCGCVEEEKELQKLKRERKNNDCYSDEN